MADAVNTFDLGTCPIVVTDRESAEDAAAWAQALAKYVIQQAIEAKRKEAQ